MYRILVLSNCLTRCFLLCCLFVYKLCIAFTVHCLTNKLDLSFVFVAALRAKGRLRGVAEETEIVPTRPYAYPSKGIRSDAILDTLANFFPQIHSNVLRVRARVG